MTVNHEELVLHACVIPSRLSSTSSRQDLQSMSLTKDPQGRDMERPHFRAFGSSKGIIDLLPRGWLEQMLKDSKVILVVITINSLTYNLKLYTDVLSAGIMSKNVIGLCMHMYIHRKIMHLVFSLELNNIMLWEIGNY